MKKLISLLLILAVAFTAAACTTELKTPKQAELDPRLEGLKVHFIDVGQGDSTLLESDGEYVLIDAGEFEYGETVRDYILSCGAERLKYIIATHPHSDHIGGIRAVLDAFETEDFITVETDCDTYGWTKTLKKVETLGVNYIDAVVGDRYTFGGASFTILAPNGGGYDGYNNYSVAVKAEYGDVSFMLTGDAERESEFEMLENGLDLSADVLKCGHHGSSDATSLGFLKAVDPAYAVISCGKDNEYGHPHTETLALLDLLGCEYLRTDERGTIVAATDGTHLRFNGSDETYTAGQKSTTPEALVYVGNRSSMYFHEPTCESVSTMNPKNKIELASRSDAIAQGYTPCPGCKP